MIMDFAPNFPYLPLHAFAQNDPVCGILCSEGVATILHTEHESYREVTIV